MFISAWWTFAFEDVFLEKGWSIGLKPQATFSSQQLFILDPNTKKLKTKQTKKRYLLGWNTSEAGIAQWLERRTRHRKVPGSFPDRSGWRMFFSSVNVLCWLLLLQQHVKDPSHSAKTAGGRLQLNTHIPYLCDFEWSDIVNWCMVQWYTQTLRRDGSISRGTCHATTKERYQYTTSVDINDTRYKRIQSLIQNHMRHVRSESAREQRITLYTIYE